MAQWAGVRCQTNADRAGPGRMPLLLPGDSGLKQRRSLVLGSLVVASARFITASSSCIAQLLHRSAFSIQRAKTTRAGQLLADSPNIQDGLRGRAPYIRQPATAQRRPLCARRANGHLIYCGGRRRRSRRQYGRPRTWRVVGSYRVQPAANATIDGRTVQRTAARERHAAAGMAAATSGAARAD